MKRTTTAAPIYRKNIFDAASNNDSEAVRLFVEGVPVASVNEDKQTAAHIAAANGNDAILKYLLGKDPTLVNIKDAHDLTILHLAVRVGSRELIKFLVDDCNANMYEPCEARHNNTPIHMAAHEGNLEALKFFIEDKEADKNVLNAYGEPPAFSAAEKSQLDIIRYLFTQGANLTMVDVNNMNILFVSATIGDVTVPRYLINQAELKFNIDWKDNFGDTIIHRAVLNNRFDFIKYMVRSHNPNLNTIDTYDRTPLHVAAEKGYIRLVRFLVGHGTDTELEDCWHRRPIESSSNYEVINYLHSVQGYKFTLHERYQEPKVTNFSRTEWGRITHPLAAQSTTCTDNNSRTRKARRRPGVRPPEDPERKKRSVEVMDGIFERRQPSSINSFWQWIHRIPSDSVQRENSIDHSVRSVEMSLLGVNGLLTFANASFKYFTGLKNQQVKHHSPLTPVEMLRNKISPIVEDAVNYPKFLFFEK